MTDETVALVDATTDQIMEELQARLPYFVCAAIYREDGGELQEMYTIAPQHPKTQGERTILLGIWTAMNAMLQASWLAHKPT